MKSHKKTILFCTGFNLFFEYSMRGIYQLITRPLLFLVILTIYLTLFIMLEDLITRFRFEDKHMILFACFFGTIYPCVISSSPFLVNPWFFGLNLGNLLFVSIVWWVFFQTLFPLYLARRLFGRDWEHQQLSIVKWVLVLLFNVFAIFLISLSPATVFGTPLGYITMTVIASIYALILIRSLKKRNLREDSLVNVEDFHEIKTLDVLGIISFCLMGLSAIFLTFDPIRASSSVVNATALVVIIAWSFIIMFIEMFFLWIRKKRISI